MQVRNIILVKLLSCKGAKFYETDSFQNIDILKNLLPTLADRITQSIYRLGTSWKVRLSNPCGTRFSLSSWPALWAHPTSCTMGTGVLSGVNRQQRDAGYPLLSAGLLVDWSCIFASNLWLSMHVMSDLDLGIWIFALTTYFIVADYPACGGSGRNTWCFGNTAVSGIVGVGNFSLSALLARPKAFQLPWSAGLYSIGLSLWIRIA